MELAPGQAAAAVERHGCPKCAAPAGSACRTRGGKTAVKYHTARFILVPALKEDLEVAVPAARGPGKTWAPGPPPGMAIRIGCARCSAAGQELASQLGVLGRADCRRVFSEKISTRVKVRPELGKALALAHEIKRAAPGQPVILTVHELRRLARNAAGLMALPAQIRAAGIQLELLTGPLTGTCDPDGMGPVLFAVLAVAGQLDRDYIREKTLEGQQAAAAHGNHGGRPRVIGDDMLTFAVALKDKGVPVPGSARKLTTKAGKDAGKNPSAASLYRALAEPGETAAVPGPARAPVPGTGRSHDRERARP